MQDDGRMEAGGGIGQNKATEESVGLFRYVPSVLLMVLLVPRSITKLAPEKKTFSRRASSYNYCEFCFFYYKASE
jgi:hypothetical protein